MNRTALEKHLREHGCFFVNHGKRHDGWSNAAGLMAPIPRHRSIRRGTVRSICRKLQIPLPRGF